MPQDMIRDGTLSQDMVHDVTRDAWKDTVAAAEQYNQPGEFTTFVAYEYTTSSADRGNLHRNVIFRDADKLAGSAVLSRAQSEIQKTYGIGWMACAMRELNR